MKTADIVIGNEYAYRNQRSGDGRRVTVTSAAKGRVGIKWSGYRWGEPHEYSRVVPAAHIISSWAEESERQEREAALSKAHAEARQKLQEKRLAALPEFKADVAALEAVLKSHGVPVTYGTVSHPYVDGGYGNHEVTIDLPHEALKALLAALDPSGSRRAICEEEAA